VVCVSTRREEWGRRCGVSVREGGGSVCYMCYVSCHGGQGGDSLDQSWCGGRGICVEAKFGLGATAPLGTRLGCCCVCVRV
jgi:hypothetical protein